MATLPPQPPPPAPGQDPRDYARQQKDYYRAWKQQQKDQWRTTRDQWKAQRDQWRYQQGYWYGRRRSIVGPIVLIFIGVTFFLIHSGHIEGYRAWDWFGRYWPVLLIAAGIGRLAEWYLDRDRPYAPRSSGFVGLIILIVIVGVTATSTSRWNLHELGDQFDSDDDFSFIHGHEHDFESQKDYVLPAGSRVSVMTSTRAMSVSSAAPTTRSTSSCTRRSTTTMTAKPASSRAALNQPSLPPATSIPSGWTAMTVFAATCKSPCLPQYRLTSTCNMATFPSSVDRPGLPRRPTIATCASLTSLET